MRTCAAHHTDGAYLRRSAWSPDTDRHLGDYGTTGSYGPTGQVRYSASRTSRELGASTPVAFNEPFTEVSSSAPFLGGTD